ncbi:hypothetical protein ACH4L5_02970 [Streptomyces sp. NPDC017405]|uniref:hypothetical protein n=1 Tax=unclassified Streptomyces TaxID=2593676 RepID=UPI0037AE696F
MFGKKTQTQQSSDLTSAEGMKRSREVYDRIQSGECKDASAELDAAHGRRGKRR